MMATGTSLNFKPDKPVERQSEVEGPRLMISQIHKSIAKWTVAGCSLVAICSLGLASARPYEPPKWTWSGNIATEPNNPPQLLHRQDSFFYAVVCVLENTPPDGPVKFAVNNKSAMRYNKSGCWLDAISDIYLVEGHAKGTITDWGPTSRQIRPVSFHFSNVAGEETDLLASPPEHPVNVKICIENMARAGQIKFTIKFYGDEPPVNRWEVPQYPINPEHYDCPEFNHVVGIWLDQGDGEGNTSNIPLSGTVYVK